MTDIEPMTSDFKALLLRAKELFGWWRSEWLWQILSALAIGKNNNKKQDLSCYVPFQLFHLLQLAGKCVCTVGSFTGVFLVSLNQMELPERKQEVIQSLTRVRCQRQVLLHAWKAFWCKVSLLCIKRHRVKWSKSNSVPLCGAAASEHCTLQVLLTLSYSVSLMDSDL